MNLCKKLLYGSFKFLLFLVSPKLGSYHSWYQTALSEKWVFLERGWRLQCKAQYFTNFSYGFNHGIIPFN